MSSNAVANIILAAGAPHVGAKPSSATSFVLNDTVVQWTMKILGNEKSTYIITGYDSDIIKNLNLDAQLVVNKDWSSTQSAYSLSLAPIFNREQEKPIKEAIICYGDILFRQKSLDEIRNRDEDCVIAWDSNIQNQSLIKLKKSPERVFVSNEKLMRAGKIPSLLANGSFVGLVRLKGEALDFLSNFIKKEKKILRKVTLADVVEIVHLSNISVGAVDLCGDWAEVGADLDIVRFVLGTKAETLSRMRKMVTKCSIEDQVSFNVSEWLNNKSEIINLIQKKFTKQRLIVRSSATSEDSFTHSNAGSYMSILNVDIKKELEESIEKVIASYHNQQPNDQVLVQPMLCDVMRSGVVFTKTLEQGAPYYVINYDETGSTDGITSGNTNDHKNLIMRRDAQPSQIANPALLPLIEAIKEVEDLLSFDSLDIEFAMTTKNLVHILQVRPITAQKMNPEISSDACIKILDQAELLWHKLASPSAHIVGKKPLYGVMPDWNPAEIIGTNPGKLSESLYRYVIMDEIWATQRAEYGYRDVRPQPLLVSFAGKPYVDVRASFNSFLPANLTETEASKLVNFYIDYLTENPQFHDKVEFEVVPTCVGPSFYRWKERLTKRGGLSKKLLERLHEGLLSISRHAIEKTQDYYKQLNILEHRIEQRHKEAALPNNIQSIRLLLDECRLFGTLPFAHLARSAFVAVTILKEGVKEGWLSQNAMDEFMGSVQTVSHELIEDAKATANKKMSWKDFEHKYGHLRPGTYDITAPSYSDDPEKFLRPTVNAALQSIVTPRHYSVWHSERKSFFEKVRGIGLNFSDEIFERFLRDAIKGREKGKFIFSYNISKALTMMRELAPKFGLTIYEWSNLSIFDILTLSEPTISDSLQRENLKIIANNNLDERKISSTCELPALLTTLKDFYSFEVTAGAPNYIGSSRIIANCVHLKGTNKHEVNVQGVIALIPQADPGYDWLFGQGIAGLITMYGGANSHMAIRSAEFGIPAAIGVGEQSYKQLAQANELELDPSNDIIRIIR